MRKSAVAPCCFPVGMAIQALIQDALSTWRDQRVAAASQALDGALIAILFTVLIPDHWLRNTALANCVSQIMVCCFIGAGVWLIHRREVASGHVVTP